MTDRSGHVPIDGRAWLIIGVAATTVVLILLDSGFVSLAFPEIEEEFDDTSRATLSWVSTGFFVTMASLLLLAGRLADRHGRVTVFRHGLAIYAIGALMMSIATEAWMVLAARVIQGAGAAALAPVSLAIVLPAFPVERRSTAVGAWAVIGAVAAVLAPLVGGVVIDSMGWRAPFLLLVLLIVVVAVVSVRVLDPDQPVRGHVPVDWLSAPLTVVGVGSLALGLTQGSNWGWASPQVIGSFVVAAIALPALIGRSERVDGALLDVSLFRTRRYAVGSLASLLTQMGFFSFIFPAPLFFTDVWGYSVLATGCALALQQTMATVAGLPSGRWADRVGPRPVVVTGGVLAAVGLLYLALGVGSEPNFVTVVVPAFVLSGVGMMMNGGMTTSAALDGLPDESLARASSGYYVTRRLGSGLGVVATAVILGEQAGAASVDRFRWVWAFSACCYLASAAVMVLWYASGRSGVEAGADKGDVT